jgi:hypothetical protein
VRGRGTAEKAVAAEARPVPKMVAIEPVAIG